MADKQAFIEAMAPHAYAASRGTNLSPEMIIAQAALETGWGRSVAGNNYFGIKSHGRSGGKKVRTHEYENGKRVSTSDSFRQYPGMEESTRDYVDFLKRNPRYQPVLNAQSMDDQIREMGASGYATDPKYGSKLASIAGDVSRVLGSRPQPISPNPRGPIKRGGNPLFNTAQGAISGLFGMGQRIGSKAQNIASQPGFRTHVAMNMLTGQNQPYRPVISRTPQSVVQALPQQKRTLIPGGDGVLKALFSPGIQSSQRARDRARATGNHSTLKRGDRRYNADINKWEVK